MKKFLSLSAKQSEVAKSEVSQKYPTLFAKQKDPSSVSEGWQLLGVST